MEVMIQKTARDGQCKKRLSNNSRRANANETFHRAVSLNGDTDNRFSIISMDLDAVAKQMPFNPKGDGKCVADSPTKAKAGKVE